MIGSISDEHFEKIFNSLIDLLDEKLKINEVFERIQKKLDDILEKL